METVKYWVVYILRSTRTDYLYTGITNNLPRRLKAHNSGKGAKATRRGRPWVVVYTLPCTTKSVALQEEARIKKQKRAVKLTLVAGRP